jgi:hypothetical protein
LHLIYCDESADQSQTVTSAIIVPDFNWRDAFDEWRKFRTSLRDRYGIPVSYELHANRLMAGQGMPGDRTKPLGRDLGCRIFNEAVHAISTLETYRVYAINVSLPNNKFRHPLRETAQRLFQRIENNLTQIGHYGIVFYDGFEGQSRTLARRILRQMQVYNPVPSWIYPGTYRQMPLRRILGDPAIKNSSDDAYLQVADIMAYALLRHDSPPTHPTPLAHDIQHAFGRLSGLCLKAAHRADQYGVVRA